MSSGDELAGHPLLSFTIYSSSERSAESGDWLQGFGIFKRGTYNHFSALDNLNYMIWQQPDYFAAGGLKIENLFQKVFKELSALDVFMQWLRRQSIQCLSFSNSSHGASESIYNQKKEGPCIFLLRQRWCLSENTCLLHSRVWWGVVFWNTRRYLCLVDLQLSHIFSRAF